MEPTKEQREAAREIVRKHERRVMVEQGFHDDTISAIAQALADATARERERCARVADKHEEDLKKAFREKRVAESGAERADGEIAAAECIARAIRQGGD